MWSCTFAQHEMRSSLYSNDSLPTRHRRFTFFRAIFVFTACFVTLKINSFRHEIQGHRLLVELKKPATQVCDVNATQNIKSRLEIVSLLFRATITSATTCESQSQSMLNQSPSSSYKKHRQNITEQNYQLKVQGCCLLHPRQHISLRSFLYLRFTVTWSWEMFDLLQETAKQARKNISSHVKRDAISLREFLKAKLVGIAPERLRSIRTELISCCNFVAEFVLLRIHSMLK